MLWLQWLIAVVIVFGGVVGLNLGLRMWRSQRRRGAATLPAGEAAVRRVGGLSVRLHTDRSLPGGLQAGGGTRGTGELVLSSRRLVLATGHGRVIEIHREQPGEVRFAGPRRLVVEGLHPSGKARVRAELVVDDAEGWAAAAQELAQSA